MRTGIQVGEAMTQNPVSISQDQTLGEAASIMAEEHVGALIVMHHETAIGIITEQDIVRKVVAKGVNPVHEKVATYMEHKLISCRPNQDLYDALVTMRDQNIRHLPVMEGKKLMGLLTLKDILRIEPALFDLVVERFEVREPEHKRIGKIISKDGFTEIVKS